MAFIIHKFYTQITVDYQSEYIGQWATPHHLRLGGIGRVVPIVLITCSNIRARNA